MMNIAWLVAVGYALSVVAYTLHASETILYSRAFIGTILLLIGYTTVTLAYTADFMEEPSKPIDKQRLKLDSMKRFGFGTLAVFFTLNTLGLIGLLPRYYDLFGIVGYGLFALGQYTGIYFVIAYLLMSVMFKWHTNVERDTLQVLSKLCVACFYILILLY